jgi:hypothetical protein
MLTRIPDPRSRIPDLKTDTTERDEKKIVVLPFFCSHKNHKNENYINFELVKKKIWANLQRVIELSAQTIVIKLGLGSGIRKKPIPYPRSRIQGSKRHRIPDPDPQHCIS